MKREALSQTGRFVSSQWRLILVLAIAVFACLLVLRSRVRVQARPSGPQEIEARVSPFGEPAATSLTDLENEKQVTTHIWTNPGPVTVSCPTPGCVALAPMFTIEPAKPCPGLAGKTCTFRIQGTTDFMVSPLDSAGVQIKVDGMATTPTVGDSIYGLSSGNPSSASEFENGSFDVIARVTNTTVNQMHTITIEAAVADSFGGDGADAVFELNTAHINTLTP